MAYGRSLVLVTLFRVRNGDTSGALTALRDALSFHAERANWSGAYLAMAVAVLALDSLGEPRAAAALAACANAGPLGASRIPTLREREAERDALARSRAAIDDDAYDALFADAADLASAHAVERALAVLAVLAVLITARDDGRNTDV